MADQTGKPFWKSKTVWFNVVAAGATALWPYLQQYVTPEQAGAAVVIGNVLLRLITTEPVTTGVGK